MTQPNRSRTVWPRACRDCGRMLRPVHLKADSFTVFTVTHRSDGRCGGCHYRLVHGSKPRRDPLTPLDPCVGCGRQMRGQHELASAYPYPTTRVQRDGMCRTCVTGNKPKFKALKNCLDCGHPIRDPRCANQAGRHGRTPGARGKCYRCHNLKRKYDLDFTGWNALLIGQQGRCASCGDPMKNPAVDHCHDCGKVRALLCHPCNQAEGLLRSEPWRAIAIACYMETQAHHDAGR